jgi:excisionase family DNA binding protein
MTYQTSLSDDLLSIAQAAVAIGVSIDTLRRWAAKGSGPPHLRVGRAIKYRRSDLLTWLDQQAA